MNTEKNLNLPNLRKEALSTCKAFFSHLCSLGLLFCLATATDISGLSLFLSGLFVFSLSCVLSVANEFFIAKAPHNYAEEIQRNAPLSNLHFFPPPFELLSNNLSFRTPPPGNASLQISEPLNSRPFPLRGSSSLHSSLSETASPEITNQSNQSLALTTPALRISEFFKSSEFLEISEFFESPKLKSLPSESGSFQSITPASSVESLNEQEISREITIHCLNEHTGLSDIIEYWPAHLRWVPAGWALLCPFSLFFYYSANLSLLMRAVESVLGAVASRVFFGLDLALSVAGVFSVAFMRGAGWSRVGRVVAVVRVVAFMLGSFLAVVAGMFGGRVGEGRCFNAGVVNVVVNLLMLVIPSGLFVGGDWREKGSLSGLLGEAGRGGCCVGELRSEMSYRRLWRTVGCSAGLTVLGCCAVAFGKVSLPWYWLDGGGWAGRVAFAFLIVGLKSLSVETLVGARAFTRLILTGRRETWLFLGVLGGLACVYAAVIALALPVRVSDFPLAGFNFYFLSLLVPVVYLRPYVIALSLETSYKRLLPRIFYALLLLLFIAVHFLLVFFEKSLNAVALHK